MIVKLEILFQYFGVLSLYLAGKTPNAFCGGKGTCGKCKVKIEDEIVLACQKKVEKDLYIEVVDTKEEKNQILMTKSDGKSVFAPGVLPNEVEAPLLAWWLRTWVKRIQ